MPDNINSQHVISIDRYTDIATDCAAGHAAIPKIRVPGFFTNAQTEGLKENEWANAMFIDCKKTHIKF